jgi:hypothetical protein
MFSFLASHIQKEGADNKNYCYMCTPCHVPVIGNRREL